MTEREQTERAIIGCLLEKPDLSDEVKVEWFDDLIIAQIYNVIVGMCREQKPVDVTTVVQVAGMDHLPLLMECQTECHSPSNFPFWRDILVAEHRRKTLIASTQKFMAQLPESDGDLSKPVAEMESALSVCATERNSLRSAKDSALSMIADLERRHNNQGKLSGLDTGLLDLNKYLDGIQPGEMTVLAARPSVGKTAIGVNLVNRICLMDKVPTLFLSLEMSGDALCRRLLACNQSINMNVLKTGQMTQQDFGKIAVFNKIMLDSPIFIRESFTGMTGNQCASLIRKMVKQHGIKFVVLDYLQKLKADGRHEKRTYEVADASASLVEVTRQCQVAFLVLAQLNRESEKDKGRLPRVSDLADSGQIERDADNVLLLHRDRGGNPEQAKLIVGKQRDGEVGCIDLRFDGKFCRFQNSLGFEGVANANVNNDL